MQLRGQWTGNCFERSPFLRALRAVGSDNPQVQMVLSGNESGCVKYDDMFIGEVLLLLRVRAAVIRGKR